MLYLKDITKFVKDKAVFGGIDVHKQFMVICILCDGEVLEKTRVSTLSELMVLLKKYCSARSIKLVYEAGFCGFWIYHQLKAAGYDCVVTPPALVP